MKYQLEVGARTIDDVLAAERGGADRVELYSSPLEGALTPSAGLIKTASKAVNNLQLFVMIRPRAGPRRSGLSGTFSNSGSLV